MIFLSCKVNARGFDAKSGHGPHSSPPGVAASPKRPSNVAFLHNATQPVWARNPDSQPTKVNLPYLEQGNLGPSLEYNQSRPLARLQNC